jgi:hypothetical protein
MGEPMRLALALLLFLAQDTVTMKGGTTLSGRVTIDGAKSTIEIEGGRADLDLDKIERIRWGQGSPEPAKLRKEYASLKATAAERARWCAKFGLEKEAKAAWEEVLKGEPENEEALKALGRRKPAAPKKPEPKKPAVPAVEPWEGVAGGLRLRTEHFELRGDLGKDRLLALAALAEKMNAFHRMHFGSDIGREWKITLIQKQSDFAASSKKIGSTQYGGGGYCEWELREFVGHGEAGHSFETLVKLEGVCGRAEMSLALALALLLQQDPVKDAVDFLISKQQADGTFDRAGILIDSRLSGIDAIAALAILAERGATPEVARTVAHFLESQDADGFFLERGKRGFHRAMIQHATITHLLIEVVLGAREKRWKVEAIGKIEAAAKKAVAFIVKAQRADGSWTYDPAGTARPLGDRAESATWVPVMEVLLLARDDARLADVPQQTLTRAMAYVRTRVKDGGFINGANETDASPHMTPAVASVLELLGEPELLAGAREYLAKRDATYFDETNTGKLGIRRRMYGLFYTALLAKRAGALDGVHAKVLKSLDAHRVEGAFWRSSIGEVGATAFAVLAHAVKSDRLAWFRTTGRLRVAEVRGVEPVQQTRAKIALVLIDFKDQKHAGTLDRALSTRPGFSSGT